MKARGPTLTLLTREECTLCEEFLAEWGAAASTRELPPLQLQDVDEDPEMKRRYGLQVPVLLLDGVRVCGTRLDIAEVDRLLRPR